MVEEGKAVWDEKRQRWIFPGDEEESEEEVKAPPTQQELS